MWCVGGGPGGTGHDRKCGEHEELDGYEKTVSRCAAAAAEAVSMRV